MHNIMMNTSLVAVKDGGPILKEGLDNGKIFNIIFFQVGIFWFI